MPKIKPMKDGPLLVEGVPNLKNNDGDISPGKPSFALCRCGMSKNKPYCDYAHAAAGFTSDNGDAKIRNTPIAYRAEVEGHQVEISYTPVLCGHIGECQRLHQAVFDPKKKPWIQPENGTLEGIRSVISACPSGALSLAIDGMDPTHLESDDVSVAIVKDGPYVVKNVPLDAEFNGANATEKEYILCRCGESKNKPFCDGSHHDKKWRDDA